MSLRLSAYWMARLACPQCRSALGGAVATVRPGLDELHCPACGNAWKIQDGNVNFGVSDAFYDEHGFTNAGRHFPPGLVGRLGLYYARHHYLYDISKVLPAGAAVIELGCGGGSRFLAGRYEMLGVEISSGSIRHAAQTYASVVQATVAELPVADRSADGIASSFLLEHLGDDIVDRSLGEMARALRPGGVMVHFFDLDATGPFFGWAKRQPWYDTIFVTSKGHSGLRPLADWERRCSQAGFEVEERRLLCRTWLQDLSVWAALDHPLVTGMPRRLGRTASVIRRTTGWLSDVATTVFDDCVCRWLPDTDAAKAIVRFRKSE